MSLSGAAPTPRVNFEMLSEYIGKTVRLVGKVESVEGTDLKLRAADEGIVTVHLSDAAPSQAFVEFDAKVDSPTEVSAISCTSFGDSFGAKRGAERARERDEPRRARRGASRRGEASPASVAPRPAGPLRPPPALTAFPPPLPTHTHSSFPPCSTDLENYNEVCRLMNGEYKSLFA